MTNQAPEPECCPKFDPKPWEDKIFTWKDKSFIKDKVFTLFHIPVNFGQVITRMIQKLEKSQTKMLHGLCLSDHTSKWNMDLYLAVDKEIPNANNVKISGKFLSRVYEGDFKDTGKWCNDFTKYAKDKNLQIKKWYMWYTTCPKCAKKYGKNYVVIIAKI
ncbi:hypothetical protein GYA19_02845 [Candidatus Beckwithbacteria bacterium]|nr:hypothetical protein [Candidatus Beckwithbacteria bacterium]